MESGRKYNSLTTDLDDSSQGSVKVKEGHYSLENAWKKKAFPITIMLILHVKDNPYIQKYQYFEYVKKDF